MRPISGIYRPEYADWRFDSHPLIGWHLVDESQRWHLYEATGAFSCYLAWRVCDGAESRHPKRPSLRHEHHMAIRPGQAVCGPCWHEWERVLALPDNGRGCTTIGGVSGISPGNLTGPTGRPGMPTLTGAGGLT